ncbi:MAG: helix-turn-helix transcriptional regulator [Gemmataceae bacterium]
MNRENVSSPLALRPREAAKALGISPRLLWQLTKDGHVPCVRVGNGKRQSVLYSVAELQAWLARESKGGDSQAEPLGQVSENGNHNGLQPSGKGE